MILEVVGNVAMKLTAGGVDIYAFLHMMDAMIAHV